MKTALVGFALLSMLVCLGLFVVIGLRGLKGLSRTQRDLGYTRRGLLWERPLRDTLAPWKDAQGENDAQSSESPDDPASPDDPKPQ